MENEYETIELTNFRRDLIECDSEKHNYELFNSKGINRQDTYYEVDEAQVQINPYQVTTGIQKRKKR
jgi:hypothetical protein